MNDFTLRDKGNFSKLTNAEARMADWCSRHKATPRVLDWLRNNPPPSTWQGTQLEYAYVEMPLGPA